MISLKAYEEYTKSNLPWLYLYPEHWKIKRAKQMYDVIDIRSETGQEDLLSVSAKHGVVKRADANVTMFKAESYVGYKLCWPEDLAINSLWAWQKGLGFSKHHGIISTAYGVYRLRGGSKYNYKYYDYYVRSSAFSWELRVRSRGIWRSRYQLTDARFLDSPMICPPKEEQDQIVRFLDSKLLKINKFIKNKKKLIELLKEKKQTIINQAVTRGLDPNAKMKASGIEWLGDVPEGWTTRRLSQIAKIILSNLDKKSYDNQKLILMCNYMDVYKNNFITKRIDFMKATASDNEINNFKLLEGDIVITKDSETWEDIAVPAFVKEDIPNLLCGYHLAIVRTIALFAHSEYLYYSFITDYINHQYKVRAKGVTRYGLSYQHIHDTNIILPPLKEQIAIASYLKTQTQAIDKTIDRITKEINLIAEYRTTLISDVATGKVDVRDVHIEEPQEVLEEQLEAMSEELPVE